MNSPTLGDKDFFLGLPKVELHAHLSGSISRECLHTIWKEKRLKDPKFDLEDPLVAMPLGKVDYDLRSFFPLFSSYIYKLCNDLDSIMRSTISVLKDFEFDGVKYLELRTTPRDIPSSGINKDTYVITVLECLKEFNEHEDTQLHSKLILSIDRRMSDIEADEIVNLAIRYSHDGVVGVDLCGDPSKGDVRTFTKAFGKAKSAGLKLAIHFAEAPTSSTDDELLTILTWNPDRLGHAIHVKDEIKKEIVEKNIGVELCLSCNVHAKMITGSYSDHHFGWWKNSGVGVALSTDDVGVFCSPLSEEYRLAALHFNLTKQDVIDLALQALDISFAPTEEKRRLYKDFQNWVENIKNDEGFI